MLGTDAGEVRERARAALGELGGSPPDPELTDYLLGQSTRSSAPTRCGA